MYYFWLLYLGIRKDNVTFFCSKKHLRKHCTPQVRKYFTPKPKTQNPKPTHTHTHTNTMHHSASLHGNRRPRVKKALGHPLRIATRGTQGARRPIPVEDVFPWLSSFLPPSPPPGRVSPSVKIWGNLSVSVSDTTLPCSIDRFPSLS